MQLYSRSRRPKIHHGDLLANPQARWHEKNQKELGQIHEEWKAILVQLGRQEDDGDFKAASAFQIHPYGPRNRD
jgi:hypothetical protein